MSAIDGKILLTKNDCYKKNQKMTPKGIVVHSTGANNPNIKRYVQPNQYNIGTNTNNNDWNRSGLDVCVHGFIGKDASGIVKFIQTLPFDICCWGVGSGSKGSYNYNPAYIQFEMCEDGLNDKTYCKNCYDKAVAVCAEICKNYNISVNNIVSHKEAHDKGYGSAHVDPTNWWNKFGYTMDGFRAAVKSKISGSSGSSSTTSSTSSATSEMYRVGTAWNNGKCVNQKGAFTNLTNAKNLCNQYAGYYVFNSKGIKVHTSTKKANTSTTSTIKAGMKLSLKSVSLYASATATSKANTLTGTYYLWDTTKTNGRYRITNSIANVGKSGQITGWIDSKYVTGTTSTTTSTASTTTSASTVTAGKKLTLKSVPLYTSSTSMTKANTLTGTYYLWDATKTNGRYRITNSAANVGKSGQITGWIDASYVK